jgi:peptidoglycan/LPS O-acetylase OafA/YrhL
MSAFAKLARDPSYVVEESGVTPRMPVLDGLRGIAILLVLLGHFRPPSASGGLLSSGWVGVDLFFVLSGFLITGILLDAKGAPGYFRVFYLRRALRILPMYYLIVAFWVLSSSVVEHEQVWYWTHTLNWRIAHAGSYEPTIMSTSPFWSLSIEEQFYAVWPALVLLCSPRRLLIVCLGLGLGSVVTRLLLLIHDAGWPTMYTLTVARLDPLVIGAALAIWARSSGGLTALARPARRLTVGLGTLSIIFFANHPSHAENFPRLLQVELPMLAMLWGALLVTTLTLDTEHWWPRVLRQPTLVAIGTYSYVLYLTHQSVNEFVSSSLRLWSAPLYFLGALSAALTVAMVLHYVIERPFLALKRHIPYTRGLRIASETLSRPRT